MGLFDKLRKRAQTTVDQHGDKIGQGIDKAAEMADRKTGGKHSSRLRTGAQKAKEGLDRLDDKPGDDIPGTGPSTRPQDTGSSTRPQDTESSTRPQDPGNESR
jgi:hypothetical protein